jgi:hypothetical protein
MEMDGRGNKENVAKKIFGCGLKCCIVGAEMNNSVNFASFP